MKKLFIAILAIAMVALFTLPAGALFNTLYEQEGLLADGYTPIDASGQGPTTDPNSTNWLYQYGGTATWSGVYSWDSNAWVEVVEVGDPDLDIEADIEMYCATSITDPKLYFHLGNIYSATPADKTAYVNGNVTYNNGMYLGITFDGLSKDVGDFEKDVSDNFTGRIFDAMVGTVDIGGRDISAEAFDIIVLMSWGGTYNVPIAYGDGAHSTITDTLWWLVDSGNPGSYNVSWQIELDPAMHQADGNYNLDPAIVAAPVL